MIGRCLEISPVSADSWFVIGISAPGYCINRCNGSACKITGNHSKACRTASAAGDGTPAVWNVSIVCLEIVWNLHAVCGIAAATGSNLVIPKDMLHIFFITIPVIRPAWSCTHHIRVGNRIFFGITTVTLHCPVNVCRTVVITLKSQFNPV